MSGQFHLFQISGSLFFTTSKSWMKKLWSLTSKTAASSLRNVEIESVGGNLCSHSAISLTNPCGLPFPHLLRSPPAQMRQTLPADGSTKETGVGMVRLYLEDLEKATAFEASEGDLSMLKESKRWKSDRFSPNVRESAHFFVSLVGACTPSAYRTAGYLDLQSVLHEFHCLSSVCIPKMDQSNDPSLKMSGCLRKIHMSVDISRNKKTPADPIFEATSLIDQWLSQRPHGKASNSRNRVLKICGKKKTATR